MRGIRWLAEVARQTTPLDLAAKRINGGPIHEELRTNEGNAVGHGSDLVGHWDVLFHFFSFSLIFQQMEVYFHFKNDLRP